MSVTKGNTPKWIRFGPGIVRDGQKTLRFLVTTADNNKALGVVAWYAQWRRYGFYPRLGTVFEPDCLREIADFCQAKTLEHRQKGGEKAQNHALGAPSVNTGLASADGVGARPTPKD